MGVSTRRGVTTVARGDERALTRSTCMVLSHSGHRDSAASTIQVELQVERLAVDLFLMPTMARVSQKLDCTRQTVNYTAGLLEIPRLQYRS